MRREGGKTPAQPQWYFLLLLTCALYARDLVIFNNEIAISRQTSGSSLFVEEQRRSRGGKSQAELLDDVIEPPFEAGRKPTEQDYLERYTKQVEYCGELCSVNETLLRPGRIPVSIKSLSDAYIERPVRCSTFFSKRAESLYDGPPLEWPPPREMPLKDKFAFGGMPVKQWYHAQKYEGTSALIPRWTQKGIEDDIELLKKGELAGTYGKDRTSRLYEYVRDQLPVKGKRVIVVGTENPWVEIILIASGAREVTTLEYGTIESEHPQLKTVTPRQINELFRMGKLEPFDIAVSFSSLEHSGLGRYGDMLNPWGDIIWTAKMSCMVKQGGLLLVNVEHSDTDAIFYNAHRSYGPWRYPLLLQNWRATDVTKAGKTIVVAVNERK